MYIEIFSFENRKKGRHYACLYGTNFNITKMNQREKSVRFIRLRRHRLALQRKVHQVFRGPIHYIHNIFHLHLHSRRLREL